MFKPYASAVLFEAALVQQREDRKRHIESTLGPIRDESQRLFDALAAETRERQLQDHKRETASVE